MAHPLNTLLREAVLRHASDLHLQAGSPPALRLQGAIRFLDLPPLTPADLDELLLPVVGDELEEYVTRGDLDLAHEVPGLARFRVNVLHHYLGRGAVFRVIPREIPTLASLGLPRALQRLATLDKGLVLATGPTGSGKSTTLAALLGEINQRRAAHVLTIEDPIEYVHPFQRAFIEQRELGRHATSFAEALRASLRESPDVVMVGEMRDPETIREALRAAETGYLVLSTLHTSSAPQTVNRIVDVFPPEEQSQIRALLSATLKAVICQQLLPRVRGGRVAAMEIMLSSPGIAGLIREGKTSQIPSFLMMGRDLGMQPLDQHLLELLQAGEIEVRDAYRHVSDPELLSRNGFALPR